VDVVLAHYAVLNDAVANINGYRQLTMVLVVTAFVPVLGSIIALAAKDTTVRLSRELTAGDHPAPGLDGTESS
jgi:hypothetical protein